MSRRSQRWKNTEAKYGRTVHLIYEGLSEMEAFRLERDLIAAYGRENLINMTDGGDGSSGWKASLETRARMSASSMGKKPSQETLAKLKGRKVSDKTRNTLSEKQRGHLNHRFGKPIHENSRAAIIKAVKGVPKTADHAAKIGAARKAFNGMVTIAHPEHGEWTDYQIDLCRRFGLSSAKVSNLKTGKRKSHKGWVFVSAL